MIATGIPKRRREPEFAMQSAVFTWARLPVVQQQYPGIDLLEGSLNGVKLTIAQAGKAKAAGMLKGAHDLTLPVARGGYIGLSIELKAGKNKPSPEQLAYGQRLMQEGWKVAYLWDDWLKVKDEICFYLAPSGSIPKPNPSKPDRSCA